MRVMTRNCSYPQRGDRRATACRPVAVATPSARNKSLALRVMPTRVDVRADSERPGRARGAPAAHARRAQSTRVAPATAIATATETASSSSFRVLFGALVRGTRSSCPAAGTGYSQKRGHTGVEGRLRGFDQTTNARQTLVKPARRSASPFQTSTEARIRDGGVTAPLLLRPSATCEKPLVPAALHCPPTRCIRTHTHTHIHTHSGHIRSPRRLSLYWIWLLFHLLLIN